MKPRTQDDYIRTALRVPPELHARIHESAKEAGRTFNAEILARLEQSFAIGDGPEKTIHLSLDQVEEFMRDIVLNTAKVIDRRLMEAMQPTPPQDPMEGGNGVIGTEGGNGKPKKAK